MLSLTLLFLAHVALGVAVYAATFGASIGDLLAQPQFWGLVLGLLSPLAVSVLKQPWLPKRAQMPLAVVFALIVGVVTVAASGQFDAADLLSTLFLVVAACQAAYHALWKPTGVAAAIETATNRGSSGDGSAGEVYDGEPALPESDPSVS